MNPSLSVWSIVPWDACPCVRSLGRGFLLVGGGVSNAVFKGTKYTKKGPSQLKKMSRCDYTGKLALGFLF